MNTSRLSVTRRFWGSATTGALLLTAGAVLGRPLLFGSAAAVFGWLLLRQYRFVRVVRRVRDSATVRQRPTQKRLTVDTPVSVAVSVGIPTPLDIDLTVAIETPMAVQQTTDGPAATLEAGGDETTGATTLVWDIAGRYRLSAPTVTLRDTTGLFVASLPVGEGCVVTVDSPRLGRVALGRTGRELIEDAGRKSMLNIQSGIEPEGIREYVVGDSMRHIDWKATARFDELYIREFNMERGRSAALVVDARQPMSAGPAGRTKLDYVRHLALSVHELTQSHRLPVGLFVCNEAGPLHQVPPQLRSSTVRKRIHELHPEPRAWQHGTGGGSDQYGVGRVRTRRSPVSASRTARILQDDESPFATRLRPYFSRGERQSRLGTSSDDPLCDVVASFRGRQTGPIITYLFTDDTHWETLPDVLRAATGDDGEAVVFLTPSVLFDTDALADPQLAYGRFVEFERFRRSLALFPRVRVYEVGPGDELAAILAKTGGRRRRGTPAPDGQTEVDDGPVATTTTAAASTTEGDG